MIAIGFLIFILGIILIECEDDKGNSIEERNKDRDE